MLQNFGLPAYNASKIKRFNKHKRLTLLICFLLEARKELLDNIVKMHDQYILDISRKNRNLYEKKHRQIRKKHKRAVETMLKAAKMLVDPQFDTSLNREDIVEFIGEERLQESINDLNEYKYLEERGYADLLVSYYPSLRKYFSDFIELPFEAEEGNEDIITAVKLIRQMDSGQINNLPEDAPISFVPNELKRILKKGNGKINRNVREMGLALAIKENMRSGNLYLAKSKQYISFWKMILDYRKWKESREEIYQILKQPTPENAAQSLETQFHKAIKESRTKFKNDKFARIENGKLKLGQDKKTDIPKQVKTLQAAINSSLPMIRIENLLMEVDAQIGFTKHFMPLQKSITPGTFLQNIDLGDYFTSNKSGHCRHECQRRRYFHRYASSHAQELRQGRNPQKCQCRNC